MDDLTSQPWFGWSLALIIGLPVLVIALSEVHLRLQRKRQRARQARQPAAHLAAAADGAADPAVQGRRRLQQERRSAGCRHAWSASSPCRSRSRASTPCCSATPPRARGVTGCRASSSISAGSSSSSRVRRSSVRTCGTSTSAAGSPPSASGSIVIGLALQTAIGSVVSGLLLLFEQPFKIGDTLEVEGVKGKVVEMNWRSTHVDVGTGLQIIPNATIAGASFANLSRPTPAHDLVVETSFAATDPPHVVTATLMHGRRQLCRSSGPARRRRSRCSAAARTPRRSPS